MKTRLDSKMLRKFIRAALEQLNGDWVILGGTLLPALGIDYRPTVDIDFAPVHAATNATSIKVMEIAERLGLPVETINASAEFFLKKVKNFKGRLVLLCENKRCRIFRPTLELYLELKLKRASESDVSDCKEFIAYIKRCEFSTELSAAKKFVLKIRKGHARENDLSALLVTF